MKIMKKEKILIIGPKLPAHDQSSGELRLFTIIKILSVKYQVMYLDTERWGPTDRRYRDEMEKLQVKIYTENDASLKKIFQDDLGLKNIFFIDPPDGESDDILLTSDRTPNKKGAEELGFEITPFELGNLQDETEVLIIFGNYIAEIFSPSDIQACFDRIKDTILFTPHKSEIDSMATIVFPTAMTPEKGGSLTNVDGKVQKFSPVLEAPGDGKAEWEILAELGTKLDVNFKYYKKFLSPEEIFRQMQKEIPFFEK